MGTMTVLFIGQMTDMISETLLMIKDILRKKLAFGY